MNEVTVRAIGVVRGGGVDVRDDFWGGHKEAEDR